MAASPLLTYAFPSVGCVLSLLMFGSSLTAVLRVRKTKRLGELNPVPFAGILGQTSGQVIYSSVIKNWFIFWANAPGLVLGLWMTLSTIVYATPGVQDLMTACVLLIAAYYSSIAVILTHITASPDTKATLWGVAGAFSLVAYYTAPLTTLLKVLRERDSSSLHPPLCFMNFVNFCLWCSYGVAIKNPIIWVPETVGGTLATSALILLLVFPRRKRLADSQVGSPPAAEMGSIAAQSDSTSTDRPHEQQVAAR